MIDRETAPRGRERTTMASLGHMLICGVKCGFKKVWRSVSAPFSTRQPSNRS
jgi:hypothetical protein